MIQGKKNVAIITARGGSKGLPRKNVLPVLGIPLIEYTIVEAKKSQYIDKIIVSTDDFEIASITQKLGIDVPFIRPKELAEDNSTSEDVILHTLNWLSQNDNDYDFFILLQPTSPLRKANHIDEAIELFSATENANTLYSVVEVSQFPSKMKEIASNGFLENYTNDFKDFKRRQDFPKLFYPNGAIYISTTERFLELQSFDEKKLIPYKMNQIDSIDIDTELDLIFAEFVLKKDLS